MGSIKSIWLIGLLLLAAIVNAAGVEVWLKNEGFSESNIVKPRYYIKNTGTTPVRGFEYWYYFKADVAKTVVLENYYNPGTTPVLENLGSGNYRVRLSFLNTTLSTGSVFPSTSGSVFAIHYSDWSAWDKLSDPALSGVDNTFKQHSASVVVDAAGNVLWGNPPSDPPIPPVLPSDPQNANISVAFRDQAMHLNNMVEPTIRLRNVGTGPLSNFEVRYYFTTENGKKPVLESYYLPQGVTLKLESKGGDEYTVRIQVTGVTLLPGQVFSQSDIQFGLHYQDWSTWDKSNDFSYKAPKAQDRYTLNTFVPAFYAEPGKNFDIVSGEIPPLMSATGAPGTKESTAVPSTTGMVTAGYANTVALAKDGTLHSWGLDIRSNLGNSRVRTSIDLQGSSLGMYPRQITGLSDVKSVECESQHCFALRNNGDLFTWGNTDRYAVNNQSYSNSGIPIRVVGLANIDQFSTTNGARNLALDKQGRVFQWGIPTNLHEDWVGDPAEVPISGKLQAGEKVTKVMACETSPGSFALTSNGRLLNWNRHNDTQFDVVPVTNIADFHCGSSANYAVNTAGEVYAWGGNYNGVLGLGTETSVTTPTKIPGLTNVKDIRVGTYHSLFLLKDGTLYGAGGNERGMIDPSSSNTKFLTLHQIPGIAGVASIDAGDQFSVAMNEAGQVYAWGNNTDWRLGVGHQNPVTVPTLTMFDPKGLSFAGEMTPMRSTNSSIILENNYDASRDFQLSLNGLSSNDIYVVLTNVGETPSTISDGDESGTVVPSSSMYEQIIPEQFEFQKRLDVSAESDDLGTTPFAHATITEPPTGASIYEIGDELQWNTSSKVANNYHPVGITLRLQHIYDGMVINAWVSDAAWGEGATQLTQAKLEDFVDAFAGSDDAIYAKVRALAGVEWGAHANPDDYISEDQNELNIVFYDFANEGDPELSFAGGYFWGAHNFKKSEYAYSNEALAIHVNSVSAASKRNSTLLTLAHEFQHMIFFYHRDVLGDGNDPTWLNEMLSMVVEDILSKDVIGAGQPSSPVISRLLSYGKDMNVPIDDWDDLDVETKKKCYAAAYSLGGYLLRQSSSYQETNLLSYLYSTGMRGWEAIEAYVMESSLLREVTVPEILRINAVTQAWNTSKGGALPQYYGYPASIFELIYDLEPSPNFWTHTWGNKNADGEFVAIRPTVYSVPPENLNRKGSVIWKWKTGASGDQDYTLTLPPNTWATVLIQP